MDKDTERREVVARWLYKDDTGRDDWDRVELPDCRNAYYESADSLLAALDEHAKQGNEPGTRYQDYDDDVWEVQTDRRPMLVQYADGGHVHPGCYKDSVGELSDVHGPLIRL